MRDEGGVSRTYLKIGFSNGAGSTIIDMFLFEGEHPVIYQENYASYSEPRMARIHRDIGQAILR